MGIGLAKSLVATGPADDDNVPFILSGNKKLLESQELHIQTYIGFVQGSFT